MKTLLYLLLFFAAPVLSFAQSLPNAGFENWTTDSVQGYMQPVGWHTSNEQTGALPGGITVAQNADAHSGNFAAEMATVGIGSPAAYYAGLITNGTFVTNGSNINIVGGSPFTYTPDTVSFYYKYQSGDRDSGRVLIYFYHRHDTTRQLVGFGQLNMDSTSIYKKASVAIKKDSLHTAPDSVLMIFQSCRSLTSPKNGQLLVDDIAMGPNTGIGEVAQEADIQVDIAPNPATNFITVTTPNDRAVAQLINIYTTDGRLVQNMVNSSQQRQLRIATDQLPAGNYFVRLQWTDGSFVHRNVIISK